MSMRAGLAKQSVRLNVKKFSSHEDSLAE